MRMNNRYEIALLPLLLCISSAIATNSYRSSPHANFIKCFSHHFPFATNTGLLHFRGTNSYNTLLFSTIQDNLFTNSTSKPLLIVAAANELHVQTSVICGKKHGLRLRVRSGGHDFEGLSYRSEEAEAFIVIDLGRLRSIKIDIQRHEAWVESGATIGELYYKISKASPNFGFPAGFTPTVGVGGHFSGGGVGSLLRKYGYAADHVIDCRLVDVHGRILDRKSMGEDLFWAVRGGGGASFGVILSFKIELVSVTPNVTVFSVSKNKSEGAINLLYRWQRVAYKLPGDLYLGAVIATTDDPTLTTNRTLGVDFRSLYLGGKEELVEIMNKEFPELGVKVEDCVEMSWGESILFHAGSVNRTLEQLRDRTSPTKSSFKGKYDFVNEPIEEDQWELIWERFSEGGAVRIMELDPYGGKMYEIPESAIPFPHRKGIIFKILYIVSWTEEDDEASTRHIDWTRKFHESMTPYVSKNPRGAYINVKDLDIGKNEEVGKADYHKAKIWGERYFKGNFKRLAVVKKRVDPHNYFWNEQSIPLAF